MMARTVLGRLMMMRVWIFISMLNMVTGKHRTFGRRGSSGRHYGGHHLSHQIQQDRAPFPQNFSLQAGVNSVLAQLELSCRNEVNFRAFNLDIVCPDYVPMVTS